MEMVVESCAVNFFLTYVADDLCPNLVAECTLWRVDRVQNRRRNLPPVHSQILAQVTGTIFI